MGQRGGQNKKYDGRGQPTKMTPEALTILEIAFSNGMTDLKACALAKISHMTLYRYQEEHPEYCERKEQLKLSPKIKAQQVILDTLKDPRWAAWYLEHTDDDFMPINRSKVEHSGKIQTEEVPYQPSPTEIAAARAYNEVLAKGRIEERKKIAATERPPK